jgi:glutamate transport system substrate-binding protein
MKCNITRRTLATCAVAMLGFTGACSGSSDAGSQVATPAAQNAALSDTDEGASSSANDGTGAGLGAKATDGTDRVNAAGANQTAPTQSVLRIGIEGDKPGVSNSLGDQVTGLDVDVAAYIAWKLGYNPYDIEWINVTSAQREDFLETGKVDLIVASYSITDARRERVDFAGPYLLAGQDLLVRAEDGTITGPESLAGKRVCVVRATTSYDRLKELLADRTSYVEADSSTDCIQALLDGQADAVTSDDAVLAELAATPANAGRMRVVGNKFSEERLGIGLPNNSPELCEQVNTILAEMVTDGSWQKFITRHTEGTGYDPTQYDNPPTPDPCE